MSTKKITDPPTNVKEAIDWLIRIGELDTSTSNAGRAKVTNAKAIEKAIQKLTGSKMTLSTAITPLIQGLANFLGYQGGTIKGGSIIKKNGYTSAYQQGTATWPTCNQGGQCSCCQQGSCNCTASPTKSCDGSCCNKCDIRICAGIFVALVPALHTALEDLKKKLKKENGTMINQDPIKGYFTALGYEEEQLNEKLTGSVVNTKLSRAVSKLGDLKKNINNAFDSKQSRLNQNGFTATTNAAPSSSTSSATPRTVREMLIWLMGLPYCQGYGQLVGELQKNKSIVTSSGRSTKSNDNPLAKELSAVIFQLPTVFYSIEGDISYLNEVFDQFKKDGKLRFYYPTTDTELLNTLSAYVAVCYPILKYLMQRCDKENSGRGKRAIGAQTSTTPAEDYNGAWGDLLVSGNENSSAQVKSSDVSGAAPSSAPPTALRDYLVFMGFQTINGTVTGDQLHDNALKDCFSESVKTDDEDEEKAVATKGRVTSKYHKLPALRKLAKHVLQEAYTSGGGPGGGAPNGTTPTTIRQMMLWLIGLPLTTAYKSKDTTPATASLFGQQGLVVTGIKNNDALKELEKGQSGTRSTRTTSTVTGKHFKQQLKDSIVGMIMLFQRIEGGLGSVLDFLKEGFKDGGAKEKFKYEGFNDNKTILDVLGSYVYKVHVQLRFLKVMCKTGKNEGGWKGCQYDNTSGSGVGYNTGSWTCTCCSSVFDSGACPKPLRNFLKGNGDNKFKLCDGKQTEHLQMGFKGTYSSSNIKGSDIYDFLKELIEEIPTTPSTKSSPTTTSKPLSCVTQYCVAIGPVEPSSLGDHFDVFRELGNGMWSKIEGEVKKELGGITQGDNDGQGASGKLQQALKAVWPGTHNGGAHDGTDLRSLTGCHEGACTPYIASLSYGLYRYFDPKLALESRNQSDVINWLYMKMSSLYGKLNKLLEEMTEKCKCCPKGSTSDTCSGIVKCPSCLPLMYKMGLVFGDPVTISTNKCSELMEKMKKVLDATSKLCVVFRSIDDKRFWPYLLFSARVVKGKNEKGELTVNGDENINCYTHKLGGEMYKKYLEKMKDDDEKKAKENKKAREGHLECTCVTQHTYAAPQTKQVTPTTVTLTLYFQGAYITQAVTITVPHHGPLYNPLVRLYPRNLKSIVDWLLRIGQTRLEQGTEKGVEDMITTFWPRIQTHLTVKDQSVFKALVEKVMSLMGLENQGKKEVKDEVDKVFKEVKDKKLKEKLSKNGDVFNKTFTSILTFNPKNYIDAVIKDFGSQVYDVNGSSDTNRSFECVAKAVSKCMKDSLDKIKNLAQTNKELEKTYHVTGIPELSGTITEVQQLTSINELKQLCDGFITFHTVYTTVTGVFNGHLDNAQKNGASTEWQKINKCVEAFNELGECVHTLSELNGHNDASQMTDASTQLQTLSGKLDKVIKQLNGDGLSTFSEKVTEFIKQLDEALKKEGEKGLAQALQIHNGGSAIDFNTFLKSYISTLIDRIKTSNGNQEQNKECDIHLRVRNDLLQLSECLKVMCDVCSTGMKEFADKLKTAVDDAKGHLEKINTTKSKLDSLNKKLEEIKEASSQDSVKDKVTSAISSIKELLDDPYIYQTQPIVDTLIDTEAVQKMTNYLKSLPDLIRDRYVLQKWKDSPEDFCGVQEFKEGIVKESDIKGITDKLKELLKDTFHTTPANDITIHEFQVRALMYNFCYKEGIKRIDCGIKVMRDVTEKINDKVEWTKIKTNKKTELLPLLTKLSDNAYLRYFATHPRDSTSYYYLCNRWSIHPSSPKLANAKTIDNCIRATQYAWIRRDNSAADLKRMSIQSTHLECIRDK